MFRHLQYPGTPGACVVVPKCLHITDLPLAFIRKEIHNWRDMETGGALVGYVEGGRIVVTHASDPGPRGIRCPNSVRIDGAFTTEFAFRLQSISGGQLYYVGDWHVHLKGNLSLSGYDRKAARKLLMSKACLVPYLVSVIFSRDAETANAYLFDGLNKVSKVVVEIGGPPSWIEAMKYQL